jgi:predicted metal-dependent peptidase
LLENYPELKLEPKKGTHHYYEKLLQGKKDGNCPNLNKMLEADAGGTVVIQVGSEDIDSQVPDHGTWAEFSDIDEATQKMIKAQTEHILKEVAEQVTKSRGTIPGEFQSILDKINLKEPPKFDWRGYLRNFFGGSTKTYTRKTRRKDSKRFAGSPGQKVVTQKHILYCIDTSGSMNTKDLVESFQELHHIHKQGAQITVVQFDAAISNISPYKRGMEDNIKIYGRGGTDFNAVVDYANENYRKFSALVVLTDGEAPPPENKCKLRTLWTHTTGSEINENLPGHKIKLN